MQKKPEWEPAARQCLVEQAGTIGRTHAPTGDLVDAYIRRVFGE